MALQEATYLFGPPLGAPGTDVIERSGGNALEDPRYGSCAFWGVLKRGPMGVAIPINSRRQYDEVFGDPRDSRWHLFANGAHLLPDAIDGFFATGRGSGQLWITRLDLDRKARRAELTLKNRVGGDALRIMAANEGRWGGAANQIAQTPLVTATSRTFTLVTPNTQANEFVDAEAEFTGAPGKRYRIVANTEANLSSGEAVFTVAAQYDLVADGVSGPVALTGTADYTRYRDLTGTIAFPLLRNVTGTVAINGRVITGTNTEFTTELSVGANVYYNGETRAIESITSGTTLTVAQSFSDGGTGLTLQTDNLTVTGTTTLFTTELAVGDTLYVEINEALQGRTVAAITSATSLTLASGFTAELTAGTTAQTDNLVVTGTGTQFATEVSAGQYLIDPNRQGATVKVASVTSATELVVEKPFSMDFAGAQLTKQNQLAMVTLSAGKGEGLAVEISQGTRYPDTHFGMTVKFNGSVVLQITDASLDPSDPLFVEPLVNDSNVAFRSGSSNYQKWITVESLWNSAYTTTPQADVRPCNGSGRVLAITGDRIYTIADLDPNLVVGNLLYPNPYAQARNYFRVKGAVAPVDLQGTISSSGVTVTGTSTNFLATLKPGDYIYDPATQTARKVRTIASNTSLTLETAFPSNLAALTETQKLGYVQVDQGYDLTLMADVGDRFLLVYPQQLTRGYDGDTAHLIPYHLTKFADIDRNHLENATFGRNQGLIRMACPGISDIAVQKAFAAYAAAKAYEFRAEVPSQYNTAAAAESFLNQDLGRNNFISVAFPSYGFISNPLGAGDRLIPLSGDVMGGESAFATAAKGYHRPFAGVDAILNRIIKLPFEALPSDEAIINVAGLHTVKSLQGNVVVFGARSPAISPTYDFTHIRRIQSNYVRVFLEARTLLETLFKPNQPYLAEQIVMVLNNFARQEYRKGVFSRYLSFSQAVQVQGGSPAGNVVTDSGSQDAIVDIVNGRLRIYFRYVPTGILERLSIDCGPDILVAQYGNTLNQAAV
ncbi:MAG TPA: hypothetical protein V6C63_15620 [Allocoleopsis sp.]